MIKGNGRGVSLVTTTGTGISGLVNVIHYCCKERDAAIEVKVNRLGRHAK